MTMCKCLVEVENIPDYVKLGDTIVARVSNGEFWFYGKYDNDARAYEVAEEIGGYVMTADSRG